MSNEQSEPGPISIEQFVGAIDFELKKQRPKWANLALAKVLHIIFPNVTVTRCSNLIENPELVASFFTEKDKPWFLGRIARCLAEIRQIGPANFPFLERIPWILTMKYENGQILPTGGSGLDEFVNCEIQEVLKTPIEVQEKFWTGFASGFRRSLVPRRQDVKSFIIYIFLATNWVAVEKCPTVRHLYEFVFSKIPKSACPEGTDPVDFEETQVKWFEKLCHRNLKLQLTQPGRPEQLKKIPQSS
jgi:hypothetical protein